uniref:Cation-transporting ATPase n=1 Tax=Gopherus agassizii TaxID=38772 RepID=A0A452HIJ8_9SAUR
MGHKQEKKLHPYLCNVDATLIEIFGYKTQGCRKAMCIAGYIFSCGALLLLFYWKPAWDVWANCIPCNLQEADVILLRTTDEFQKYTRKKVTWIDLSKLNLSVRDTSDSLFIADKDSVINRAIMKPELKVRSIQVQKIWYIWDLSMKQFQKVGSLDDSNSCYDIHDKFGTGLTREEQNIRRLVCGPNAIEVEIRPIWKLLFKEILNPFYVFQTFTLTLWLSQGYVEYSVAIIILSVISIGLTVYDLRQQSVKLHDLVEEHNKVQVTACTKDEGEQCPLESHYLVPGDILVLEGKKHSLPCDAILIDGGCIVDEGMLTGESIPVTKTPLPHMENTKSWKTHSAEDYRRHVLFCGTEVIQTKPTGKGPVRAVVLQTGFNTAKGDLVRSILYPKPMNFKLYRDAFKFIIILTLIGVLGLIYTVCVYVQHKKPVAETVAMALLLFTVSVPPAIPAALTTGIVYAQKRLKNKKIFCISPQRINICGQINLVCFDKTGTLTEDGLDLWGLIPSEGSRFQNVYSFASGTPLPWGLPCGAMASCHSLIVLDEKIQGDPLDRKMFECTCWEKGEEGDETDLKEGTEEEQLSNLTSYLPDFPQAPVDGIAILHQFPFSSGLQRMSVITQQLGKDQYDLYMKGAPEMVTSFCRPETVPTDFVKELKVYTTQGFRVIALAHRALNMGKDVELDNLEREEVESDLTFLGLLIMENRLKAETKPVLEELSTARIRSVMITGDNLQTAVTVAKNSGMISKTSKVILIEASEPEGPTPASITWQLMEDSKQMAAGITDTCVNIEERTIPERESNNYHFALNGKSYQIIVKHFKSLLPKILVNGTVFARMSPGQKSSLIEEFQKLNSHGQGDELCSNILSCSYTGVFQALKMAHAGISLSEQEASVASPFTSQVPNIECVPELIREGRAALVASFAVFKYLTLYGLTQFIGTALLYWIFGNYQYLMQDVVITLLVCLTMSLTQAYPKLAPYRPPGQLISPPLLLSVILHTGITAIMLVCGFLLVKQQPWYSEMANHRNGTANATDIPSSVLSYEDTTLWPLTTINCIILAFVFSKGKPFRKPIYTNCKYSCINMCFPVYILIMLFVTFCVSFFVEDVVLQNRHLWLLIKKCCQFRSRSQYRKWQRKLEKDPTWPPLKRKDFAENSKNEIYINPIYEHDEEN